MWLGGIGQPCFEGREGGEGGGMARDHSMQVVTAISDGLAKLQPVLERDLPPVAIDEVCKELELFVQEATFHPTVAQKQPTGEGQALRPYTTSGRDVQSVRSRCLRSSRWH